MAKPKKETRIMKVTLDADEFEKFDQGITHSDNGLRNEKGRLSALPDIAPVTDDDRSLLLKTSGESISLLTRTALP